MSRGASRTPSPWWVLLPGVLLALAGWRAVAAEADRARDDARAAARSVGRALENLVAEYAAPLDGVAGVADLPDATRHLYPVFVLRADGGDYDTSALSESGDDDGATEDDAERDAALAADVLSAAGQADDDEVAAALLAGAAEAVSSAGTAARLRLLAAEAELSAGRPDAAVEELAVVFAAPRRVLAARGGNGEDDRPLGEHAVRLLLAAARETTPPSWTSDILSSVQRDALGLGDAVRTELAARLATLLPDGTAAAAGERAEREWRALREHVRDLEWSGRVSDACCLAGVASGSPLLVMRRADLERGPAWIVGAIPDAVVGDRLAPLVRDRATAVQTSEDALPGAWTAGLAAGGETVSVTLPTLAGWHVDVGLARSPVGVPPRALLLAALVAGALVALALGAFALARAAREQARLAHERRAFLDHVAHEIRTPAAAILALSEQLVRGGGSGDDGDDDKEAGRAATYHQHLVAKARRLADLVEETLDLTRLESGRLAARRERCDLRDVVAAGVAAAAAGRPVQTSVPDHAVPADVDRGALCRAVRNLVDNALRHGASPRPPEVTLSADGTIRVRDHGEGIADEHLARIFERFHSVPTKASAAAPGVGLGLALVREVAAAHGGSVSASSPTGGGALLTLRVPVGGGGGG